MRSLVCFQGQRWNLFQKKEDLSWLRKVSPEKGKLLIKHMKGSGTVKLSTDEIIALTRGED